MQRRQINIYAHGERYEGTEYAETDLFGNVKPGTGVRGMPMVRTGPMEITQERAPTVEEHLGVVQAGGPLGAIIPIVGGLVGGLVGGVFGEAITDISQIPGIAGDGGPAMANGNGVGLYGHAGMVRNGGMVPVGGPGVPEPPAAMVAKQWKTKAFSHTVGEYWVHFFKLIDGRMMCYNAAKREWKMWRPKKPIVLYRGKVTLSQAVRAQRMLDKLWKTVAKRTKALKLA